MNQSTGSKFHLQVEIENVVTLHPPEVELGDFCKIDYYALHERLTRTNSCD